MPDDTRAITHEDFNAADWSSLPALVRRALPPRAAGLDPDTGARRYRCSQAELDRLASAADSTMVSVACSLRAIGLLSIYSDERELAGNNVDLGDTITTLAELILALRDLKDAAEHGQATEGGKQ